MFNNEDVKFHRNELFRQSLRVSMCNELKQIRVMGAISKYGLKHGDHACLAEQTTCYKCGKVGRFAKSLKSGRQRQPRS